jgi:hypothetical protein
MVGRGGALSFRPPWLRLDETVAILVDRGVASEAAEASLGRAISSGIRVRVRSTGSNPSDPFAGALRYRVHTEFQHYVGTKWWAQPQLNFPASTIEVPSLGDHGSLDEFEIKPRWQLIEIWADDLDKLWSSFDPPDADSASSKSHEGPVSEGIREAIAALWPSGMPKGLRAKDRNNRIADWLKQNGRSVPFDSGLARAIQRALKP